MNGAFGGDRNAGEPAKQTLADLTSAPTGVLALHVQDVVLHLKGKLISVAIGTAAAIGESLHAALLIAIEYLVAGFAGDAKLPTEFRHWLAGEPASHKLQSFIHYRTLLPRHSLLPKKGKSVTYVSGTICYLCLGSLTLPKCSGVRLRTETSAASRLRGDTLKGYRIYCHGRDDNRGLAAAQIRRGHLRIRF